MELCTRRLRLVRDTPVFGARDPAHGKAGGQGVKRASQRYRNSPSNSEAAWSRVHRGQRALGESVLQWWAVVFPRLRPAPTSCGLSASCQGSSTAGQRELLGHHKSQLLAAPWESQPWAPCSLVPSAPPPRTLHTQRQEACRRLAERTPFPSTPLLVSLSLTAEQLQSWQRFSPRQAPPRGGLSPCRARAGPPGGFRAKIPVRWPQAGKSDLGPPAFDELHDLLDLQLGQAEVICQDVLTELHEDAAVYALSGKEADHVL